MCLLFFISLTKWNIKMTAFFIFLGGKKQSEEKFFISFHQGTILYTLPSLLVQGLCSHLWWLLQLQWITSTLHSVKAVLKFISSSIASIFPCIVSVPSEYIHATLIPVFTKEVALYDFTQAIIPSHFSALLTVKLLSIVFCTHCFQFLTSHSLTYPFGSHYSTDTDFPVTSILSYLMIISPRSILIQLSAAF